VTDELARDPQFRAQYERAVDPDPQVEAALYGAQPQTFRMQPAAQPLSGDARWVSSQMVRLR
jgi:hypothetical protein